MTAQNATALGSLRILAILLGNAGKSLKRHRFESVQNLVLFFWCKIKLFWFLMLLFDAEAGHCF